ncbi:MAG TPA: trigger factor [Burkholderiaceae bacterium]|nr:trigger factor [Burkholderiaceae bacterium]
MATQLESIGTLERRLNLSVPKADVDRQVQERLRSLSTSVRMPGFRPGKVPLKMIQQSYGPKVHAEVLGDAVSKALSDAVAEHKLRIAGQPRIEPSQEPADDVVAFSAVFEVYPEVQLKEVSQLQLERFQCPVGDAEVDKTIEILRKQRTVWEPAGRPAADADRVTIDFVGRIDGEAFEGGSANDMPLVLGEGRVLPDLENGLRGIAEGETREIDVAFPADYGAKELAGKTAKFEVRAKKVEAPKLPELDEQFAKQLGVSDGDLQRMRNEVRANLEREVAARLRARTRAGVMEALPSLAEFELPKSLIEAESAQLAERARSDLKARGVDVKDVPIPPDAFREQAEKRVRLGLIVAEIVRQNQLQAKPDQLRKQIEEFAQSYENPGEVVRWYFSDRDRLAEVEALVVEQNVVDWVLAKGATQDRPIAFDELMAAG